MPYIETREHIGSAGTVENLEEQKHLQEKLQAVMGGKAKMPNAPKAEEPFDRSVPTSNGAIVAESKGVDAMEDVTYTSGPPTPPLSGTVTPTRRVPQCPARLRPLVPPPNFGAAKSNAVFRSAFPQDRNMDFLKTLRVKTVLCLVATDPSESYSDWISQNGITRLRVDIAANKDGKVSTTWDSLCEALLHVLDAATYPLYVHCNQGRHRTGCVIACLRRVQRWPIEDILAEYRSYADPKARPGDIDLIENFDPNCLFDYAQSTGFFEKEHRHMGRVDSGITNVDMLAEALSSMSQSKDFGLGMSGITGISGISNASTVSDDMDLEAPLDPALLRDEQIPSTAECTNAQAHQTNGSIVDMIELNGIAAAPLAEPEATTTVTELSEDAMTPPALIVPNPLA